MVIGTEDEEEGVGRHRGMGAMAVGRTMAVLAKNHQKATESGKGARTVATVCVGELQRGRRGTETHSASL